MNSDVAMPAMVGLAFVRAPGGIDPFYSSVIAGMEEVLHANGLQAVVHTVPSAAAELATYRRWAADRMVVGVVVSNLTANDPRAPVLQQAGLPYVTLGEPIDAGTGSVVRVDNYGSMIDAVGQLVSLGHRVIGRVSGPVDLLHTQARSAAFDAAVAASGVTGSTAVGDYSAPSGVAGVRSLLAASPSPTALIFDNDVMAVAGLEEAQRLGIDVPRQLSIVAWDDSTGCLLTTPTLSAMSHNVHGLGALAARALLRQLQGGPATDETASPPVFIARGSTAPPPTMEPDLDPELIREGVQDGHGDPAYP